MEDTGEKRKNNWFIIIISLCCLAVIFSSFYFFYFKKQFNFIIEVSCDSGKEQCFNRSCAVEGDCPPNNLSVFKRYSLKASDFKYCENEDCKVACESGQIKCEPVPCENDIGLEESCISNVQNNLNS